ncbi:MAG: substrate-binding periplasmic protein [Aggregatilineales bacterium]
MSRLSKVIRISSLLTLCSVVSLLAIGSMFTMSAAAQGTLVTLVPPTLLPTNLPPTAIPQFTTSALAAIRADKDHPKLTIGILYNAPPFASLDPNGEIVGFEADIGRAIAQDWGIPTAIGSPPIFRQVTRQNGEALLLSGQIDMLMGRVIHTREMEKTLDFSDTLFVSHEVALTLADNPANSITDLAGQTVGVVIGSPAEQALAEWQKSANVRLTVEPLGMLDDGIRLLINRQIGAVIADRWTLDARVRNVLNGVKLLNGSFRDEPYAIAIRPHDDSLRLLLDRTLQRLGANGHFDQIYKARFPESILPADQRTVPIAWNGLADDKRTINDFPTAITLPAQPVLPRMASQKTIRVAGIGSPDAKGNLSLLDGFDQALVNEMAKRWRVTVQFVPGGPAQAEDQVASGAADLAVGVEPRWESPDRVDFVGVYAVHGYRLMVANGRNIHSFADFFTGGRNIGIYSDDPNAFDKAVAIAKKVGVAYLGKYPVTTDDDIVNAIASGNLSAIFGDSMRVVPYALANPKLVTVTDTEYTRNPFSFAVPLNDSDFRALVAETLQDMARDGTYQSIFKAQFNVGNPQPVVYWP